jgi:hypothetical protein
MVETDMVSKTVIVIDRSKEMWKWECHIYTKPMVQVSGLVGNSYTEYYS